MISIQAETDDDQANALWNRWWSSPSSAKQGQTRSPVSWLWRVLLLRRPSKAAAKYWQIGGGPACFQLCLGKTRPDPNTDPDPLIRRGFSMMRRNVSPAMIPWWLTNIWHKCMNYTKCAGISTKLSALVENLRKVQELGTYHVQPATVLKHRKKLSFWWNWNCTLLLREAIIREKKIFCETIS